jgi:hypothetical protein
MAGNTADWRELAKDLYREAQTELQERWRGIQVDVVEIFKEELREALLDLKQAVIDGRQADGERFGDEVYMILVELRLRSQGDSNA